MRGKGKDDKPSLLFNRRLVLTILPFTLGSLLGGTVRSLDMIAGSTILFMGSPLSEHPLFSFILLSLFLVLSSSLFHYTWERFVRVDNNWATAAYVSGILFSYMVKNVGAAFLVSFLILQISLLMWLIHALTSKGKTKETDSAR